MTRRRIPEDTADYARWLADQIEARGERTSTRLSPATAFFVGLALREYAKVLDGREASQMNYMVSRVAGSHVQMLAACRAGEVAWAAFHLAIAAGPRQRIVLRHAGRLLAEHGGEDASAESVMIAARPIQDGDDPD